MVKAGTYIWIPYNISDRALVAGAGWMHGGKMPPLPGASRDSHGML